MKLIHHSLHSELWPKYLSVELAEQGDILSLSEQQPKIGPSETSTIQQAAIYNELPGNMKQIENLTFFTNNIKGCYKDKVIVRALIL